VTFREVLEGMARREAGQSGATQPITWETVEAVLDTGRYVIRGTTVATTGQLRPLAVGSRVPVAWKNGKPVAVLLAMGDEDELERLILAYSPKFQDLLRTAEKQVQEGLGIPHDKFWREMENESRDSLLATEGS